MPFAGLCQCPKWIGASPKSIESLMGLMEQRLSFKFSDSSVVTGNRMVKQSVDGRFVLKMTSRNGLVENINLEAPTSLMEVFAGWFEKAFEECTLSKKGQVTVYENFVVLTRPLNKTRSYFYMSTKEE